MGKEERATVERLFQQAFQLYDREGATTGSLIAILTKFKAALPLLQEIEDKEKEAVTNLGIGRIYSSQGKKLLALHYYNQALSLFREEENHFDEATTLWEIGKIYSSQGEKEIALDYYNQALSLLRKVDNLAGEINILIDIARVYNSLGTQEQAQVDYNIKPTNDYILAEFPLRPISNFGGADFDLSNAFIDASLIDASLIGVIFQAKGAWGAHTDISISLLEIQMLISPGVNIDDGVVFRKAEATLPPPQDPNNLEFADLQRGMVVRPPDSINQKANLYAAEDSGGDTPPPEPNILSDSSQPLIRYPNLDCPHNVILKQKFALIVELLIEPASDELEFPAIQVQDTGTNKLPEVEVFLSAEGFDILGDGSNIQIIEVNRNDDSEVMFQLLPKKLGLGKIKVKFYQNGKFIYKAERNILVSQQAVEVKFTQSDTLTSMELKGKGNQFIPPQDMELYVDVSDDKRTLCFRLTSNKQNVHYRNFKVGKVTLQNSPIEKMQQIYEKVNQLAQNYSATDEDKRWSEKRLVALGNELWRELIPEQLKQEYWKFKSKIGSFLVNSEEPWIPWEMIKPYRFNDDDEIEQDPFWCQQFALSRWLSSKAALVDNFKIKSTRTVSPTSVNLSWVKDEINFVNSLSDLRCNIECRSTYHKRLQVLDCLENEDLSILHFACHGLFDSTLPENSAIELDDGKLSPSDLHIRFGGEQPHPLIFINACHGGRTGISFTGLGGWAERFVNARTGAFIGAMWEVNDRLALMFATTFYTAFLRDNKSIAESFREARETIRKAAPHNSTWLAYTLYGDPEGRA